MSKVKDGTIVLVDGIERIASGPTQKAIDGTFIVWYYDDNGKVCKSYQDRVLLVVPV